MSIDSLGGISSASDMQSFSSEVVTKTSDTAAGMSTETSSLAVNDKESFGAAVAAKTLDSMNSGGGHGGGSEMAQSYDFNKTVLSGYAPDQGTLTDIKV